MAFRPKGGLSVMSLRIGASKAIGTEQSGGFKLTQRDIGDRLADVASGNTTAVQALEDALRQTGARRIAEVDVGVAGNRLYAAITVFGKGTGPVTYHAPIAHSDPDTVRDVLRGVQRNYNK